MNATATPTASETTADTPWVRSYTNNFGKTFDELTLREWSAEIAQRVRRLAPGEVLRAVRALADDVAQGKRAFKYPPTVNDLIHKIFRLKEVDRAGGDAAAIQSSHDRVMSDLKARISNAPDNCARWDIIATPRNNDDCAELESFARRRFPDYAKPRLPTLIECRALAAATPGLAVGFDRADPDADNAHRRLFKALNAGPCAAAVAGRAAGVQPAPAPADAMVDEFVDVAADDMREPF